MAIISRPEIDALCFGGAKGGAKSFFLCRWAFSQCAKFKGNKGFLGRKRSVDFNNTTLETWRKAIPIQFYKINEQKKKIFLPYFDSVIDYGGLDDPKAVEKFNSAEYGFIGVDQAEEIGKDDFGMLRATLRHRLPDGKFPDYKILLTSNPAECWLKQDFILNPQPRFAFLKSLPSDNPFLPPNYTDTLRQAFKHRPELLQAYLYGSWDDLSGFDTVIKIKWIDESVNRQLIRVDKKCIVALDPAEFGDDESVIYCFENERVVDAEIFVHSEPMQTAGKAIVMARKHKANLIAGDDLGIGSGIFSRLREMGESVRGLRSSEASASPEKFANLRAEMWWTAGEMFAEGRVSIPDDPILRGELAQVKYKIHSSGTILIESKDDMRKRGLKSPNRADALIYGLYSLRYAAFVEPRGFKKNWKTSYKEDEQKMASAWAA